MLRRVQGRAHLGIGAHEAGAQVVVAKARKVCNAFVGAGSECIRERLAHEPIDGRGDREAMTVARWRKASMLALLLRDFVAEPIETAAEAEVRLHYASDLGRRTSASQLVRVSRRDP